MNDSRTTDRFEMLEQRCTENVNSLNTDKPVQNFFSKKLIKWAAIFFGVTFLMFFILEWPHMPYKLYQEDGEYYIYVDTRNKFQTNPTPNRMTIFVHRPESYFMLRCDSLDVMYAKFSYGLFTDKELQTLGRNVNQDGEAALFDLDNLYDAVFPEGLPDYYIMYRPSHYQFFVDIDNSNTTVSLRVKSAEDMNHALISYFNFENAITIEADSPDANAMRSNAKRFKYNGYSSFTCNYIIAAEHTTFYVEEYYSTDDKSEPPNTIVIYAQKQSGECFYVAIEGCKQRPDVQWLASFDIKPYNP